jgi:hypothetical protein
MHANETRLHKQVSASEELAQQGQAMQSARPEQRGKAPGGIPIPPCVRIDFALFHYPERVRRYAE